MLPAFNGMVGRSMPEMEAGNFLETTLRQSNGPASLSSSSIWQFLLYIILNSLFGLLHSLGMKPKLSGQGACSPI